MKLKELMEKRAKAIADARALLDRAEKEGRDLIEEESRQYDALIEAAGRLKDHIEQERQQRELEREIAAADGDTPENRGNERRRRRDPGPRRPRLRRISGLPPQRSRGSQPGPGRDARIPKPEHRRGYARRLPGGSPALRG